MTELVLVTGGSRGIGRAIVELLAARAQAVAFTYAQDQAAAEAVVAATQGRALAHRLDLRDRAAPGRLVRELETGENVVAGLVNNAGSRRDGLLALTSDAEWDETLEIDLSGPFRMCRAVLPGMLRRRRGAIVNVASLSALRGIAGQCAYSAAKAGLLGMTRALAREVGKRGVRVNAVAPGFVATDFVRDLPAEAVQALRAHEALPQGVSAHAVAETVLHLLSDAAAAVTGQTLVVDAGAGL